MFGSCECLHWGSIADHSPSPEPQRFALPASMPQWPEGQGFATGKVNLGELEVIQIASFNFIWASNRTHGIGFYKPVGIPDGFFSFGHYCQQIGRALLGFVLVARELVLPKAGTSESIPALHSPLDYTLIWSSNDVGEDFFDQPGYFWKPEPPKGYKALGFVVTNKPKKPNLEEVKCVRADLTDQCEICGLLLDTSSNPLKLPFRVWMTRPSHRGISGKGIPVGTFFCSSTWSLVEGLQIECLKNFDPVFQAMPNLGQIHSLIHHYGPTVYFHPSETYLPSSIAWFFKNGALLWKEGETHGAAISITGSNLPAGGTNDGKFWINLPNDDRREIIKRGDLNSAELYVHIKPALGGTFVDIAMWIFSPFNGPANLKVGLMNYALKRVGEHVGDWEHFTLRISNFTGKLHSIYFSQHSGGQWVNACDLEYAEGNKAAIYASRNGHACYPCPGTYIQGSETLGIGVRNDCAKSKFFIDSSVCYQIIAAEYLGESVVEPHWLQYMREWGPTIAYDTRREQERLIRSLPRFIKSSVQNVLNKLPAEIYGEEGPTGPKEKNNWFGDERW
ncbi:hypothetical protein Droror1_Dr00012725 [Drosera rotundifolia]